MTGRTGADALECVVGIDAGGTKTACVMATLGGQPLGYSTGGPANFQVAGERGVLDVLRSVLVQAQQAAGTSLLVRGLCLAMAGAGRPRDREGALNALTILRRDDRQGIEWRLPDSGPVVVHDALAALVGGTGKNEGVVVIAGTGSIAYGRTAAGVERRAGGWGYLLGDEGSGYAIGLSALRAACRAADGRGPATLLVDSIKAAHDLAEVSQLVPLAYGTWRPADIAALAPLVIAASEARDTVATDILLSAADELALAARAVIDGLELSGTSVDVVTSGTLWAHAAQLTEHFTAAVQRHAPLAKIGPPKHEPIAGAVLLARESIGVTHL
ncbi:MAG TPA: BadF/BadG/BcrA/BcrD ATPase family protein [Chloroflexota bacterium]|nr:BadF/BadG/BcrA/BcrD ATPase family protein [Chloroflexota bacterium]